MMFFAELLEALCTPTHFVHGHTYKVYECSRTVPLMYADIYFVRGQYLFSTGSDGKQQTKVCRSGRVRVLLALTLISFNVSFDFFCRI